MSGALLLVGGHEDTEGDLDILRVLVGELRGRPLLLAPLASRAPEKYVERYRPVFARLGVACVTDWAALGACGGVYFTGGSQARLVARLSDGRRERLEAAWRGGAVVAGTSAGASALGAAMIVRGAGEQAPAPGEVRLEPALGLLPGVLVDQHFTQRGRSGRLRAAIARRPDLLAIGIDEDTAVLVRGDEARVVGAGSVTVLDAGAADIRTPEGRPPTVLDLRVHALARGDHFDLARRAPRG